MSGVVQGLLERIGIVSQDEALFELHYVIKYAPAWEILCINPETRDTFLHALLRIPQCGESLFTQLKNWFVLSHYAGLSCQNADGEDVISLARRLGHARLQDLETNPFDKTEEEEAAALVARPRDWPGEDDPNYEELKKQYQQDERAYSAAQEVIQEAQHRRRLPVWDAALAVEDLSSKNSSYISQEAWHAMLRKKRFHDLCKPPMIEVLPALQESSSSSSSSSASSPRQSSSLEANEEDE